MSLPTAEELQRAAAVAQKKDDQARRGAKPRFVVRGQRSLSSESFEEEHAQDGPEADEMGEMQLREVDQEASEAESGAAISLQNQQMAPQSHNPYKQARAAFRGSNVSSRTGKSSKLTKKSASQMSQKSVRSQVSAKSSSKGQMTQRSNRSQAREGNGLKKSGGPKAQPGQGRGNRPPKSQRADKQKMSTIMAAENNGEEKFRHQ